MSLSEKQCVPCEGGIPPLNSEEILPLLDELNNKWHVIDGHHLERTWEFKDFIEALDFVNSAGAICEEQFHHAEFDFGWGRVNVKIWTHKIDGLSESDFVLAAKLDQL
ncbi:MAG: pterin-4-alpha-carbinolamine dehydratase [Euryarchaeota archaeon]|nr:pterin-4-alpha-carbinolamine dehydratase [Euryarchaeota archaeon]|tara:strand:- start:707 stop:1030 length:324 start_codon:yes stop_codon:yes gene_type:complete